MLGHPRRRRCAGDRAVEHSTETARSRTGCRDQSADPGDRHAASRREHEAGQRPSGERPHVAGELTAQLPSETLDPRIAVGCRVERPLQSARRRLQLEHDGQGLVDVELGPRRISGRADGLQPGHRQETIEAGETRTQLEALEGEIVQQVGAVLELEGRD